jgi:hypothetical protein
MTARGRLVPALLLALLLAPVSAGVALADAVPDMCLAPDGTPTSCPAGSGPDPFGGPGPGLFGTVAKVFLGLFVVAVLLGVATTVWRVRLARRMAMDVGLDPDQATAVTMLSGSGAEAAYLAATLRDAKGSRAAADDRPAEDRLRELQRLRDQGLVTEAEYAARRTAIVESL